MKYLVQWKGFMVEYNIGGKKRFEECKKSSGRVQGETKYRSYINEII